MFFTRFGKVSIDFCLFQLVSNGILYFCVNIAGLFIHNVTERAQRKTFIKTRNCIASRLDIEDENEKLVIEFFT